MNQKITVELKESTTLSIDDAVQRFSNALIETEQFRNYERAREYYQQDAAAQKAFREYQILAQSLQTKQMFNTVTPAERSDMERLWTAFMSNASVAELFNSQEALQELCRQCAQEISGHIGLDYATSCGASCCG